MTDHNHADELENFDELEGQELSAEKYFRLIEKEQMGEILTEEEQHFKLIHGLKSGNIKLEDAVPAITKKIEKNGLEKN